MRSAGIRERLERLRCDRVFVSDRDADFLSYALAKTPLSCGCAAAEHRCCRNDGAADFAATMGRIAGP